MTASCQRVSSFPRAEETERLGFYVLPLVSGNQNQLNSGRTFPPSPAMDEQAGPGVFFNNNNNSVLPGGGKGSLPDGDAGETARAQYSIPGILHFLQHEWARFEVERAQWEVERAELQVDPLHYTYNSFISNIAGPRWRSFRETRVPVAGFSC